MKKHILFAALSLISSCLFSQEFYLNMSEREAIPKIKVFFGDDIHFTRQSLPTNKYSISWQDNDCEGFLFFDKDISYKYAIVPNTSGILHSLVEVFNKKFTIISDTEWICYKDDKTYSISLLYGDEIKKYVFYISLKNN
jgi:hypothetical protein